MLALYENVDRLRAEQALDDAQAALVPHLTERGRQSYLRQTRRRTLRLAGPDGSGQLPPPAGGGTPFTVNGVPVGVDGLQRWLAQTFGMARRAAPHRNGQHGAVSSAGRAG